MSSCLKDLNPMDKILQIREHFSPLNLIKINEIKYQNWFHFHLAKSTYKQNPKTQNCQQTFSQMTQKQYAQRARTMHNKTVS